MAPARLALGAVVLSVSLTAAAASEDHAPSKKPRVAVVGAGVGGAVAAWHLRRALGANVDIVVLEAGAAPGGRARLVAVGDDAFEAGASIVAAENRHLRELAAYGSLDVGAPRAAGSSYGITDNGALVFQASTSSLPWPLSLVEDARAAWRYGLPGLRLTRVVKAFLARWEKVYEVQNDRGVVFETPEELLRAVGLHGVANKSLATLLSGELGGETTTLVEREVVGAAVKVSYNQDAAAINALAGLVACVPTVSSGGLWAVEGGNELLASRALDQANAALYLGVRVARIERVSLPGRRRGGFGYTIRARHAKPDLNDVLLRPFDAVVLAAPLETAGVEIVPPPPLPVATRPFQRTVTTFVEAREVNRTVFDAWGPLPASIMPESGTTVGGLDVSSVSQLSVATKRARPIFKVFSERNLPVSTVDALFMDRPKRSEIGVEVDWPAAYPKLSHPVPAPAPFRLGGRLFYVGALETYVSAMEVAAVAGVNVGRLAARDLQPLAARVRPAA